MYIVYRVRVICEDDGDDVDNGVVVNFNGHTSALYPALFEFFEFTIPIF
jgi:hypothetical protein